MMGKFKHLEKVADDKLPVPLPMIGTPYTLIATMHQTTASTPSYITKWESTLGEEAGVSRESFSELSSLLNLTNTSSLIFAHMVQNQESMALLQVVKRGLRLMTSSASTAQLQMPIVLGFQQLLDKVGPVDLIILNEDVCILESLLPMALRHAQRMVAIRANTHWVNGGSHSHRALITDFMSRGCILTQKVAQTTNQQCDVCWVYFCHEPMRTGLINKAVPKQCSCVVMHSSTGQLTFE
jgi:hypothetical protein